MPLEAVNQLIDAGHVLTIAGHEELLRQLHKGNWMAGTTPYFMDKDGGGVDYNQVFVTDLTDIITNFQVKTYTEETVTSTMLEDRYDNGFSLIILPAFSSIHQTYALQAGEQASLFDKPIMGWIAGIHLEKIGQESPKVIDGSTGEVFENRAAVLHGELPSDKYAELDLINIYDQGAGDTFTFEENAFKFTNCMVNGKPTNIAHYYKENKIDSTLPLVANYAGASINVSIESVNEEDVSFFAPLLQGREYKVAKSVDDKYTTFCALLPKDETPIIFSCNCILNYVHIGMQNKFAGNLKGPFTFGEVAYILVNQTMVTLSIKNF
jgi:hypothetical protein